MSVPVEKVGQVGSFSLFLINAILRPTPLVWGLHCFEGKKIAKSPEVI
jgi:hypothetical protein